MNTEICFLINFHRNAFLQEVFRPAGLRVFFNGSLCIANCYNCCRLWYFTFNGIECSAPAATDGLVYIVHGNSSKKNLHGVRQTDGEGPTDLRKRLEILTRANSRLLDPVFFFRSVKGPQRQGARGILGR